VHKGCWIAALFCFHFSELRAEGPKQKTTGYAGGGKELIEREITPLKWQSSSRQKQGVISVTKSLAHTKWMCKYHIVFTPKYRRKIIYNKYKTSVEEILKDLCKWKGIEIIEGKAMIDHIHLLVSIPPKYSVSSVMGYLKGKSAMMIFDHHANLKYKYGNRHFWSRGYYVSTVGLNEATIAKYVREQDKHDQMMDRISTNEVEDPFRGS
jgi:putative transposase